jgi:glutamate synthase (ferredoxin)
MPLVLQMFISGKPGQTGDELERQLFIVRKLIERAKAAAMGAAESDFYVCSLSNRTIVYKVCSVLQRWLQQASNRLQNV